FDLGPMNAVCPYCGALHWMEEKLSNSSKSHPHFGMCCDDGKVQLPLLRAPPRELQDLLQGEDAQCREFRENIWQYNMALAFTSLGANVDLTVND
ncbi:hypothetical protein K435DRAFT_636554, partial [Dendrothele bispora CBS 962.96]